jgi:Mg2+/Co2+ transporter CorC
VPFKRLSRKRAWKFDRSMGLPRLSLTRPGRRIKMQVIDHNDKVKALFSGTLEELTTKATEAMKDPDTKMVVIGNLPKLGDSIFINNLKFRIKAELSRNRLIIQLVGPADESEPSAESADG